MITENPFEDNQGNMISTQGHGQGHIEINLSPTTKPGKKLIHFSDGVMEEEEELDETDQQNTNNSIVDPRTLNWFPWFAHYASVSGTVALSYADYFGETLANFFGITTPKYQLEINEFERQEAARKKLEEERAGWITAEQNGAPMVTQPTTVGSINEKPVTL